MTVRVKYVFLYSGDALFYFEITTNKYCPHTKIIILHTLIVIRGINDTHALVKSPMVLLSSKVV